MEPLKLIALDPEDLQVVSAHVQDAVLKVADIDYRPQEKRLVLAMNRFVWEKPQRFFRRSEERRRSALHFDRVLSVRSVALPRDRPDEVLSLLAIRFVPGNEPEGTIELVFSGGAVLRLDAECIEARLSDLGAAWEASARPAHRD